MGIKDLIRYTSPEETERINDIVVAYFIEAFGDQAVHETVELRTAVLHAEVHLFLLSVENGEPSRALQIRWNVQAGLHALKNERTKVT